MKIREVVLTKNDSHPYDYKEMTFKDFIIIQNATQEVANTMGYPIYLVGSAQRKHLPRDIDLAIIIPHDLYVERYSKQSEQDWDTDNPEYQAANFLTNAWYREFDNIQPLEQLNFEGYKIDLKICPDNWFTEKEKTLLAKPRSEK